MRNDKSPEKQNGSYGPEMESNKLFRARDIC